VVLAAVLSGARISGSRPAEQRIVLFGAGTAGLGIADQLRAALVADGLTAAEATARLWCLDRFGLLTAGRSEMRQGQVPYARPIDEVALWRSDDSLGGIPLAEVVAQVAPTVLIGASGQPGAFSEEIVKQMASRVERPVILPLSNPTSLAEASPTDLLHWTDGRALVATGSPYGPVVHDAVSREISQANNALAFPGLALGALAVRASRITDRMLRAAAEALVGLAASVEEGTPLLPAMANLRLTSVAVAAAVARAAAADGVAGEPVHDSIEDDVRASMWDPHYRKVVAI
jgi:malate dehydrogenase (oxaloacetate-decarboxylating)